MLPIATGRWHPGRGVHHIAASQRSALQELRTPSLNASQGAQAPIVPLFALLSLRKGCDGPSPGRACRRLLSKDVDPIPGFRTVRQQRDRHDEGSKGARNMS